MSEEKKYYEPVIFDEPEDKDIAQLSTEKSFEERLYYALYTDEDGIGRFYRFEGRTECFNGIKDILRSENIDPIDITILVEMPGKDLHGNIRWFMMNPNDPKCKNAFSFYMAIRNQFPDDGFDIFDYTTLTHPLTDTIELNTESDEIETDLSNLSKEYMDILKQMCNTSEDVLFLNPLHAHNQDKSI